MNKKEALIECLKGNKVIHRDHSGDIYIYWDEGEDDTPCFVAKNGVVLDIVLMNDDGWKMYKEPPRKVTKTFYRAWFYHKGQGELMSHDWRDQKDEAEGISDASLYRLQPHLTETKEVEIIDNP